MSTRQIPDGPEGDQRMMAVVTFDSYGRPRQVEREFREALEKVIFNEFGRHAKVTSITSSGPPSPTSDAYGDVVTLSDPDPGVVEE